jgi:hypothetical protein
MKSQQSHGISYQRIAAVHKTLFATSTVALRGVEAFNFGTVLFFGKGTAFVDD